MGYLRCGVVMGGCSAERQISLRSGQAVAAALELTEYEVVPVVLGPGTDTASALASAQIDLAFLALHGRQGEDGCIQGLLELMGVPYSGSGVLPSALALDKLKSKELFRLHNVPTPPYYLLRPNAEVAQLEQRHGNFGFPVVVKPRREGSSFGVAKANNLSELRLAVAEALKYGDEVLVERFIQGREIAVGLLDGRVLGAIEIAHKGELYDYAAKYTPGRAEYFVPARLSVTSYQGVLNLAQSAATAIEVSGAVRVDLLVTEGQNEYVLEVNTAPGMTETSLLPRIAREAGFGFSQLCEAMLEGPRRQLSSQTIAQPREAEAFGDALTRGRSHVAPVGGHRVVARSPTRGPKSRERGLALLSRS